MADFLFEGDDVSVLLMNLVDETEILVFALLNHSACLLASRVFSVFLFKLNCIFLGSINVVLRVVVLTLLEIIEKFVQQ